MSNRSYFEKAKLTTDVNKIIFQFPVGMSNRSYQEPDQIAPVFAKFSFNSPWECRIGLTQRLSLFAVELCVEALSIPRGNVE